MANYIRGNILCEAYIHVEPEDLSSKAISKFEEHIREFASSRGEFFLYPGIDISIDLREGSLRSKVKIYGLVVTLVTAVSQYPDFREGVMAAYADVKSLANYLVNESLFASRSKGSQIIGSEARTGVLGSARRVISKIDTLIDRNGTALQGEILERLQEIDSDIKKLFDDLVAEEDKKFMASGMLELISKTPMAPSPTKGKASDHEAVKSYRSIRSALKKYLKVRAS